MPNVKVPPHSDEAEKSVLGALLLDKDSIVSVAEFLRAEHFYTETHSQIYQSIMALYEERKPIDLVTLTDQLKKQKALKRVGGSAYLSELANSVPTAAHIEEYGRIVK